MWIILIDVKPVLSISVFFGQNFSNLWPLQDLTELDIDLAAITQAGKSTRMPLQYAEKNQCGEVGDGESGGRQRPRRIGL